MPRGRGGRRQGTPGKAYANRGDLNRPYVGQQYGQATQQREALQAIPLSHPRANVQAAPNGPAPPQPGAAGPFNRPSERPDEPVTAGLPMGAGPGPESLGVDFRDPPEITELRAIYRIFPTQDLAELLEDWDHGVRF